MNNKTIKIKINDNTKKNDENNFIQKIAITEYDNENIVRNNKNKRIEIERPAEYLKSPKNNMRKKAKETNNNKENYKDNNNKIIDININKNELMSIRLFDRKKYLKENFNISDD